MKKFLALFLIVCTLFCLGACKRTKPGEFEQNDITVAQNEIITAFGKTENDIRLVAYEHGSNYLMYVVAEYDKGIKTSEAKHYFYYDVEAYNIFCEDLDEEKVIEKKADIFYVKTKSGIANNGSYEQDLENIQKKYIVK